MVNTTFQPWSGSVPFLVVSGSVTLVKAYLLFFQLNDLKYIFNSKATLEMSDGRTSVLEISSHKNGIESA